MPSFLQISGFFITFLFLSSFMALANERWSWHDPVFKNYAVEQGLPHGTISNICEDNIGFIWLTTTEGLLRFDGVNFERVATEYNGVSFGISSMVSDDAGFIWMSTSQGLMRFEPQSRDFRHVELDGSKVGKITFNSNHKALVGTTSSSFFTLDIQSLTPTIISEDELFKISDLRTFSIVVDDKNTVWLGTSHGLYFKNGADSRFTQLALMEFFPNSQRISDLTVLSNGQILVATPRSGIVVIDEEFSIVPINIPNYTQEWIFSVTEKAPNVIWLGTFGKGIIELELETNSVKRMRNNRLIDTSVAHDEVWRVYTTKAGLIWVATNNGLSVFDSNQYFIKTIFGDTGTDISLSDISVNALAESPTGDLIAGLRSNGADIIAPVLGVTRTIDSDPIDTQNFLPGGAVETVAIAPEGSAYLGSNWGIYHYQGEQLSLLETNIRPQKQYTGALFANRDFLWAGGTDGLWRFSIEQKQVVDELQVTKADGLTNNRITVIGSTPENEILVGTWSGLNWLNEDGAITHQLPASDSHFEKSFISSFFYDDNERLWFATEGAGVYIANEKGHPTSFKHIGTEQGLSSNTVRAIQPDRQGRVWVATMAGLDVIESKTLAVHSISNYSGSLVPPYYRNASLLTSNNEVLFGGTDGLNIIEPNKFMPTHQFSPLVIINTVVGDQTYLAPDLGVDSESPILIPADKNKFSVEFTTLDYIYHKSIKYRYRLIDLEVDWIETDAEHTVAAYTTLPPGFYQLEIQNSNRAGDWNTQSRIIHINVLPCWYQTLWAQALFMLLVIMLVSLLVKLRTSTLNRRKEFLEEKVRLRTFSLEQTTKALEEQKEALAKVSVTDPLTGIYNRRFLDRSMPTETALTTRKYYGLPAHQYAMADADMIFFLIDIDHFKQINDKYGHQAGDKVLIEITRRLKTLARESDYLVRWGGEEFLFVVRETSRELAANLAERILQQVESVPFTISNQESISLTCSVGFVPFPFCSHSPNHVSWGDCIDIADKALYTAKEAGRNTWVGVTLKDDVSSADIRIDIKKLELAIINLNSNQNEPSITASWQRAHNN